jgi:hypothetical protein
MVNYCKIERRNRMAEIRQVMRDQESTKGPEINSTEIMGREKWRRGLVCSEKLSMRVNMVNMRVNMVFKAIKLYIRK